MGVGIVVLAHEHTRRLQPLVERIRTDILPARSKLGILLAAEERGQIVVKPSAAIVTRVDHHGVTVAVTSEQIRVDSAETGAVHPFYVDITDPAARNPCRSLTVALHPPVVEQVIELTGAYRLHHLLLTSSLGSHHTESHFLARLSGKKRIIVGAGSYLMAVDTLDDYTRTHLVARRRKRTAGYYFSHLQSVALVILIEERSERSRRLCRTVGIITCACMRSVQFAEHLRQHLRKIVVVVDMVKEAAVGFMVSFPVHTMDFRIIELVVDLTPCVIEYILTFHSRTIVEVGLESDILGLAVA